MSDDTPLPFVFPVAQRKKVTAAFGGGRITANGGVMLPAEAERRRRQPGRRLPSVQRARRESDLNLIRVGDERYEIPDAVVLGG